MEQGLKSMRVLNNYMIECNKYTQKQTEIYREIDDFWTGFDWRGKLREIEEIERQPLPAALEEIPGIEIEKNGTKFIVHGIVHSSDLSMTSLKYCFVVKELCRKFYNPEQKEDLICEDGIKKDIRLKISKSFEDRSIFYKVALKTLFSNMIGNNNFGNKIYIQEEKERRKQIKKIREIFYENADNVLRDPLYLPKFRQIYYSLISSPPIINHKILFPSFTEVSKYMARRLQECAHENELNRIHAIVGLYHEPQIATLLKYPDYPSALMLANIYPLD